MRWDGIESDRGIMSMESVKSGYNDSHVIRHEYIEKKNAKKIRSSIAHEQKDRARCRNILGRPS